MPMKIQCKCGREHRRLVYLGRRSYEVHVGKRTIFPIQVEEILRRQPETRRALFRLVKYASHMDYLAVETTYDTRAVWDTSAFTAKLAGILGDELDVPVQVHLLGEDDVPRGTYKIPVIRDLTR